MLCSFYQKKPSQTSDLASQKLSVNTTKSPYKQAYYLSKQISTKPQLKCFKLKSPHLFNELSTVDIDRVPYFSYLVKIHVLILFYKYVNLSHFRHPATLLFTDFTNPDTLTSDLLIHKLFNNKQIISQQIPRSVWLPSNNVRKHIQQHLLAPGVNNFK